MTFFSALPFAAAAFSLMLAAASVLRKDPSVATWCFAAGMAVLALDSACTGLSLHAATLPDAVQWLTIGLAVKAFLPAAWLGFSLTYSRGDYRASLAGHTVPVAMFALLPVGLALASRGHLIEVETAGPSGEILLLHFGAIARILNVTLLVAFVLILMNLEQTFRSAVGTMRWRIKFVILGLAAIFGAHAYVRSQAVLFSMHDAMLTGVESSGLLIGCAFLALAYSRTRLAEADVYPSRAVLRSSLTVLIAGGYLFIVGVLAQAVRRFGGAESFQFQAFVVLLGMAGLAVLLLSDRLRQRARAFVSRHFGKAQHDSVGVWTGLSRRLAGVGDEAAAGAASARFVSETFEALSVSVWLIDEERACLVAGASTARESGPEPAALQGAVPSDALQAGLGERSSPFDLDAAVGRWAEELRRINPKAFAEKGGSRWCVPLAASGRPLGAMVLADRVNGAAYTAEEIDLLKCIGDQMSSVLLNLRLANEVARAKELEAFRTMSAFFVHDLKNAAASLNLMLKNLPVHFDDPAYREDALGAVGRTAQRIDQMIARLGAFRQRANLNPVAVELGRLVGAVLDAMEELRGVEVARELEPVPAIQADADQIRSVLTNLLLNARDALGPGGRIRVRTEPEDGRVVLTVADNGCGMSREFLRDSLFRPFQTTKKKGLGIGMYQARIIVHAHGGSIQVASEEGQGTTVRVSFPIESPS